MNEIITLCLEIIFWFALFIVFYISGLRNCALRSRQVEKNFREACEAFVAGIGRWFAGSDSLHYSIQ